MKKVYDYSAVHTSADEKVALTPEKEGAYGANDSEIVHLLQEILCAKYALDIAYRSFADRTRGPWRDALVDHWYEHAKEERQAAYDVAMKIVGLGSDAMVSTITVPQCPANLEAFCICLTQMELETVNKCRDLLSCVGDNVSMRVFAENLILQDTQHIDDLRRMCGPQVG